MTLLEVARDYLTAGLSIIALSGKLPNTKWHPNGLKNFLSGVPTADDYSLLQGVFEDVDTTGVGIVISAPYFVVDVDGEEGAVALRNILGSTNLDLTPVAKTGRGLHVWFADWEPHASGKLAPKLDIKGVGGYVAAPPSLHASGTYYEWLRPLVVDGVIVPPMEAPMLILSRMDT